MSEEHFDVSNVRITPVKKTWAGCPGLRIQAYRADGKRLYIGPEIPIPDTTAAFDLLKTIHQALEAVGL